MQGDDGLRGFICGGGQALRSEEDDDREAAEAMNCFRVGSGSISLQRSKDLAASAECSRVQQITDSVDKWIDSVQLSYQVLGGDRPTASSVTTRTLNDDIQITVPLHDQVQSEAMVETVQASRRLEQRSSKTSRLAL
jgi:hypothetical protein